MISVAGTIPIAFLKGIVSESKVVRIMPNMAIMVQASYTAYCCDDSVTQEEKEKVKVLLNITRSMRGN